MLHGRISVPEPQNEPVKEYRPGSPEREELTAAVAAHRADQVEIPLIIGGKEVRTGDIADIREPHAHGRLLGRYHQAGEKEVQLAAAAAKEAAKEWSVLPARERAAILLRAGHLLAGPWRMKINAATVVGQSKTCHQAEIDSACELIDFLRFNAYYMQRIYAEQPHSPSGVWNYVDYRPLEGFVFAVTPFNFTAIAGNLPTSPALMGCTVLWKPASSAILSGYYVMRLLEEAGLPPGVINFLPGRGSKVGNPALAHPDFAGLHFTGSTPVFQGMWRQISENLPIYGRYPRIVGETGGKDFIFAHPSADVDALRTAIIRGGFEYQGQKCSAASRLYIPDNLWPKLKERLVSEIAEIPVGDPSVYTNFMGAVIDESSFDNISSYLEHAESSNDMDVLVGGNRDKSEGYFIRPTLVQSKTPDSKLMCDEIFGPVVTALVYPEGKYEETLGVCDRTSPYALTGAIFSQDRAAIRVASERLRHAAGNFYINDKPTGAVVNQQPFGGARASGTNDKAGSAWNLIRWTSIRAVKENLCPPTDYRYPFLG